LLENVAGDDVEDGFDELEKLAGVVLCYGELIV